MACVEGTEIHPRGANNMHRYLFVLWDQTHRWRLCTVQTRVQKICAGRMHKHGADHAKRCRCAERGERESREVRWQEASREQMAAGTSEPPPSAAGFTLEGRAGGWRLEAGTPDLHAAQDITASLLLEVFLQI